MLYLVPTPIGNLQDITLRSLEILKTVDAIICEDTRRTGQLLHHFEIKKPLLVLNDYNESLQFQKIIAELQMGKNLALVSDAGTPLISDPGFKLVRECRQLEIPIDALPGPSSILPALTMSGLPTDKFLFLGYMPDKPGHRQTLLTNLSQQASILKLTYIIFIAPFKLVKTLTEMEQQLGDIQITLAKELTKIYQRVESKSISLWLSEFKKQPPKGEWVGLFRLD